MTRLPDEEEGGWCNPLAFEQMWLPMDLPLPTCRAALGAVLKDGQLRYLFPCVETTVTTMGGLFDGQVWHNRGLNSLPLAKTWMAFNDVPVDDLRLSCYRQPLPPPPPQNDEAAAGEDAAAAGEASAAVRSAPPSIVGHAAPFAAKRG